jgi:pyruvate dehydrogenase E2 component (dihydrolipoamide acetyltransferase)
LPASQGGWAAGPPPKAPSPSAAALAAAFPRLSSVRRGASDAKPSPVRRVIASRLTESKASVPHSYAAMDCGLDALLALRASLKSAGQAVSVNDLVIAAAARALRDVPEANAHYDGRADAVRAAPGGAVDISVAVATDGGLITPIVRGADALPLPAIGAKVRELAGRARAGKLKPEEFQGGTFTISNLGMFGSVNEFSAVINMPQACILAVGKGERKVRAAPLGRAEMAAIYGGGGGGGGGPAAAEPPPPTVQEVMTVTLSADARVVDARVAGMFLQAFRHYVENPALLIA